VVNDEGNLYGAPGQQVGKYRLLRRIAAGGMAEVFLATDDGNALWAVKLILPHLADQPEFLGLFLDEARLAALIKHPNVAEVRDMGMEGGRLFLAMEYVRGQPLSSLLHRMKELKKSLTPAQAAEIVAQSASGLYAAHMAKDRNGKPMELVHRDVSPQNLLLTEDGQVKVVDFGIAKAKNKLVITQANTTRGKPWYMSPEQMRGEHLDGRADIFALGATLFELLLGSRLFEGDVDQVMYKALNEPLPDLAVLRPDLPKEIVEMVKKACARKPEDRFETAWEMEQELHAFAVEQGGSGDLGGLVRACFPAMPRSVADVGGQARPNTLPPPVAALPAPAPAPLPPVAPPLDAPPTQAGPAPVMLPFDEPEDPGLGFDAIPRSQPKVGARPPSAENSAVKRRGLGYSMGSTRAAPPPATPRTKRPVSSPAAEPRTSVDPLPEGAPQRRPAAGGGDERSVSTRSKPALSSAKPAASIVVADDLPTEAPELRNDTSEVKVPPELVDAPLPPPAKSQARSKAAPAAKAAPAPAAPPAAEAPAAPEPAKKSNRNLLIGGAIGGVILLGVSGGLIKMALSDDKPAEPVKPPPPKQLLIPTDTAPVKPKVEDPKPKVEDPKPAEPKVVKGIVRVSCTSEGYPILFVDGENSGEPCYTALKVAPGTHKIGVSTDGKPPRGGTSVTVKAGEVKAIYFGNNNAIYGDPADFAGAALADAQNASSNDVAIAKWRQYNIYKGGSAPEGQRGLGKALFNSGSYEKAVFHLQTYLDLTSAKPPKDAEEIQKLIAEAKKKM
jgi:serine/threonine-protein kinase